MSVNVYDCRPVVMTIRIEFPLTATVEVVGHYSGGEPLRMMILVGSGTEYQGAKLRIATDFPKMWSRWYTNRPLVRGCADGMPQGGSGKCKPIVVALGRKRAVHCH
jgi:hypothetical protein